MEPVTEMKMSRLPVRTWSWLHMNESHLTEEETRRLSPAKTEEPVRISAPEGEAKEYNLPFLCSGGESRACRAELYAKRDSSLTVWMEISSQREAGAALRLTTTIRAEARARVRLIQVQLLGADGLFADEIKAECREGAQVELLQIFLGGAKTWAGLSGELAGADSSLSAQLGYWCRGTQRLDMNYVVRHTGKRTNSRILTRGVLDGEAFKLFRGTIDFIKGASGSEGTETEDVLMLGEDAVNQTIPLILCGEEDVRGNHGATIGEPDEEMLFYMASRGIGTDAATACLARARIDGLRSQIGNDDLEKKVERYLEEVMEYA